MTMEIFFRFQITRENILYVFFFFFGRNDSKRTKNEFTYSRIFIRNIFIIINDASTMFDKNENKKEKFEYFAS